ncbi:MAG: glycosyltransferase [Betaproteobacteria bacterium]
MLSFVICSVDAAKFAGVTHSLERCLDGAPHEIVGVHDARSLCEGWARGLARARGAIVVFCHDDIEVHAERLARTLARHLERFDIVGVAGTRRCVGMDWSEAGIEHAQGAVVHDRGEHPEFCFYGADGDGEAAPGMQAMDGVFLATRRDVAESIGFDAHTFDGWHGYDADFTFRAHLARFRLGVALDLPVVHASAGRRDDARMRYQLRFAEKHAARLASGRGAWVDARAAVAVPEGIAEAWSRANLARLHAWTREEARRRTAAAMRPNAAGRNEPCPCGSGLRYKECHGRPA